MGIAPVLEHEPSAEVQPDLDAVAFLEDLNWRANQGLRALAERRFLDEARENPEIGQGKVDLVTGVLTWEYRDRAVELCIEAGIDIRPLIAQVYGPILETFPDATVHVPRGKLLDAVLKFEPPTARKPLALKPSRQPAKRRQTPRRTGSRRARAPALAGEDRPHELEPRVCARADCGAEFEPTRRDQTCCSSRCAAAHRKARSRSKLPPEVREFANLVWKHRRSGHLTGDDALELLVMGPSPRLIALLAAA